MLDLLKLHKIFFVLTLNILLFSTFEIKAQDISTEVEEIIVTGSRIKTTATDSFSPVSIIGQEDILLSGKISIGEVLLELPGQGSGLNRTYNNGGDGSVRIDFRNLGAQRTLVLVDGRRWVNSGEGADGSVDINTIPTAAVERVEVLKDGASSIYGSDAIGAVINIITKDSYDGLDVSFQRGEYFDGGGLADNFSISMGTTFDGGSFIMGASYVDIHELSNGERSQTAARPSNGGSAGTPQGRLAYSDVVPGCSSFQPTEGTSGSSSSDFRCWTSPEDRFNYNPYNYVETPNERKNFFAKGTFEIAEDTSVTLFGVYQNRVSDQLLAPMPLFYGFGSFGGSEGISRNNPYNPFGIEFCDLTGLSIEGKTCDDVNYPGGYSIGWVGRRLLEAGNRNYIQDTETYRISMGLETKIADWDFSAYFIWAQNKNVTTTAGLLNTGNIKKSLSGNDCTGSCVPLNLFGGQGPDSKYLGDGLWSGSGSITTDMVNYITFLAHDTGENEMKNFGFDFSGEIAQLSSGPVGIAIGYEHRKEEGGFEPDAFIAAGLSSGNAASPVKGEFEVDEAYLELASPLADGLDLSASLRYSDYSSFGETTNAKYGLTYSPNEIVTFRATFAEGFRAPSIADLYSGNNDSYPDIQDPCDVNAANFTGNTDGTQTGQCLEDGVPTGFTQPNSQIRVTLGGNPNVQPEESEGLNLGVIIEPLEGLKLYADYYEIEITDTISTIGSQLIINGCYRENNQVYCGLIDRLSTGFVDDLRNTTNNIGIVETSGFELAATYDWSDNFGNWRATSEIAFLDTYDVTKADGSIEHYAGYVTGNGRNQFKEIKGNFGLIWNRDVLTLSLSGQYHGKVDGVAGQVPRTATDGSYLTGDDIRSLGDTWYWDAQANYIFENINSTLTVGIDNIFDEDPPFFPESFANDFDPSYRTWGSQFWYVRVASQF